MCGRFAFFSPAEAITAAFGMGPPAEFTARYNIAPSQSVHAIVHDSAGAPAWTSLRWGLVPSWAKDPAVGNRMINARAETVAGKPAYRAAFRRRRCLIPASGFYEWQSSGERGKTPWFISRADGLPLAMAGIWEHRERKPGEPDDVPAELFTCSILTTAASDFMQPLHHRMPVMLERRDFADWLDVDAGVPALQAQLAAAKPLQLQAWAVSRAVNSPRNDKPELVAPLDSNGS